MYGDRSDRFILSKVFISVFLLSLTSKQWSVEIKSTPCTKDINWTHIKHSVDVQDVF